MSGIALTPEETRLKNLLRISQLATFLGLAAASPYIYLGIKNQNVYDYIIAGSLILVSLVAFVTLWERKTERTRIGAWPLLVSANLAALVLSTVQTNAGAEIGTAVFIVNLTISILTISPERIIRAIILGAVVSVACSTLAFYSPIPQYTFFTGNLVISWVARITTLASLGLLLLQFRNLNLANKFLIAFLGIIILVSRSFAIILTTTTANTLTDQIGQKLHEVAKGQSVAIGDYINGQVELLYALSLDETVRQSVRAANALETDLESILVLDEQWRNAFDSGASDPLIESRMSNSLSTDLRSFQRISPENIEVFVTDKQGAIIATTGITSDYYQADEPWWHSTNTRGEAFISTPEFDESANALSIILAIPINDTRDGQQIGILRTTISVERLISAFGDPIGETGELDIFFPEGTMLDTGRVEYEPVSADSLTAIQKSIGQEYIRSVFEEDDSIMAGSLIRSQSKESPVNKLDWNVIVSQNTIEALEPVNRQVRVTGLFGMIMAGLASMLSLVVSQRLADPILKLTSIANEVAGGNLEARSRLNQQDEIGQLSFAFNDMTAKLKETLFGLEARVAERTAELETTSQQLQKRAEQFQAMAQMTRAISSFQDINTLLPRITQLVNQLFGFYHVGLFLLDHSRQYAVLSAANSEGGQRMLARKHRLGVGQTGIVGYVTSTGNPRIALDTEADSVFFDNPDLPETHSEMALPLRVGKTIIGALDVQSTQPNAFTEEDVEVLSILADEVSVAIENARLFEESQQVLADAQRAFGEFTLKAWQQMVIKRNVVGYELSGVSIRSLEEPLQQNGSSIAIPIKLRDRVIGAMNIVLPGNKELDPDEADIAHTLAERIGIAIESATLLEESRRRATRESMVSEISAKLSATAEVERLMQVAVSELRDALGASEVVLKLGSNGEDE